MNCGPQAPLPMRFSRQEYWRGLGCHFLLQGIFPTQGSNQSPPRQQILYYWAGKPISELHYLIPVSKMFLWVLWVLQKINQTQGSLEPLIYSSEPQVTTWTCSWWLKLRNGGRVMQDWTLNLWIWCCPRVHSVRTELTACGAGKPTPWNWSWNCRHLLTPVFLGFPGGSGGKESTCNVGDWVWSLGWQDPLEEGMATPSVLFQDSGESPWTEEPGVLVHGIAKSWTRLSD